MKKTFLILFLTAVFSFQILYAQNTSKEYEVFSPDGRIKMVIKVDDKISYRVYLESELILANSPFSMTVKEHGILGKNPGVKNTENNKISEVLYPVVPVKSEEVKNEYNELIINFADNFCVDFRVFNDGTAYRFRTKFKDKIFIESEEVNFNFTRDYFIYYPEEESFFTHSERLYKHIKLSEISSEQKSSIPALVELNNGIKAAITESDLIDYPGLYLSGSNGNSLHGVFPAVALEEKQTRDRDVKVEKRAGYIAETDGSRSYPWRIMIITDSDKKLIESRMVFKLSGENRIKDTSWIQPGKVAWDWWNANNVWGVDFKAGINTGTYKYYIDFASKYGIEYIILDEGWYKLGDLFDINPDIDMQALLDYAKKKNVGIILWVIWKTLDDQLNEALDLFEKWGVKGIKVDFMQRDDQWMVNYYYKIAEEAAKRHLIVDFHGSYKPAGLHRTYPNVLTREGVKGLENNKWSKLPDPEHNVTLPFTRMLAGPMDYTPGAMINAQEKNFNISFTRPMSLGTRCHQLAMYVVFESPLQMLADSPSNYLKEEECMQFLSAVPTVWEKTIVLDAKVGDYVMIARKNGNAWYIGGMTDWTTRELTVDFSFLDEGRYTAKIYSDGINADRNACDYKLETKTVRKNMKLNVKLESGGGFAAIIRK